MKEIYESIHTQTFFAGNSKGVTSEKIHPDLSLYSYLKSNGMYNIYVLNSVAKESEAVKPLKHL